MPEYSPETLQQLEETRKLEFQGESRPTLHVTVDYSEGETAKWFSKGEAPVLEELVKAGKLPPVAERVGTEPIVMEGPEGIGRYGGTMIRAGSGGVMWHRMTYANLVRFSPCGYPIKPHIARDYSVSDDSRVFTFHLRKGMRWSDGHT